MNDELQIILENAGVSVREYDPETSTFDDTTWMNWYENYIMGYDHGFDGRPNHDLRSKKNNTAYNEGFAAGQIDSRSSIRYNDREIDLKATLSANRHFQDSENDFHSEDDIPDYAWSSSKLGENLADGLNESDSGFPAEIEVLKDVLHNIEESKAGISDKINKLSYKNYTMNRYIGRIEGLNEAKSIINDIMQKLETYEPEYLSGGNYKL